MHPENLRVRTTARYVYPLALLLLLLAAIGCETGRSNVVNPPGTGGNNNNPGDSTGGAVEVTITPAESALLTGGTEQFYASVTGTANTGVAWTVASGPGTISADGLYTAPATIDADTVRATVKVTASAQTSASATASIVITRSSTNGGGGNGGGGNGGNGGGGNGGGDTLLPGQICFERDVLPIFQSSCAMSGCHDAGTAKHGYVFNSYSGIMRAITPGNLGESDIYEMIIGKDNDDDDDDDDRDDDDDDDRDDDDDDDDDDHDDDDFDRMPPPPRAPLTAEQIDVIRQWILQGAKDTRCSDNNGGGGNGGSGGGGCDTNNVTFSSVIKPILQNNCVGCHSGPTPPRGLNLSSYSGVKMVADNGKLVGAVSHAPGFPKMPQGANKLPDCSIAKIRAWVNKGAPNN